jgi:hypothetical protein
MGATNSHQYPGCVCLSEHHKHQVYFDSCSPWILFCVWKILKPQKQIISGPPPLPSPPSRNPTTSHASTATPILGPIFRNGYLKTVQRAPSRSPYGTGRGPKPKPLNTDRVETIRDRHIPKEKSGEEWQKLVDVEGGLVERDLTRFSTIYRHQKDELCGLCLHDQVHRLGKHGKRVDDEGEGDDCGCADA